MLNSEIIPEKPDDIVITGISGCFPKSNSVLELEQNLKDRLDLIDGENSLFIDPSLFFVISNRSRSYTN